MLKKIVLASQSPRRRQLLEMAEINFEVKVVPTEENYPDSLQFEEVPLYIAEQKAVAVMPLFKEAIIVAADTIVVLKEEIIGKPKDESEAINILKKLSNNTHQVITGVVIVSDKKKLQFNSITKVHFNQLSDQQIQHYVQKYQPYDKAGAYAIQEWIGAIGIAGIEGDFYNVMGLPIHKVAKALKEWDD